MCWANLPLVVGAPLLFWVFVLAEVVVLALAVLFGFPVVEVFALFVELELKDGIVDLWSSIGLLTEAVGWGDLM